MNKFALTLAVAALVTAAPAFANEEHAAPADATAAEATASAEVAAPAAEAAVEAKEVELADGSKVVIEGDVVSAVGADGAKTPAADGEHKAKDGTTITVKDGKLVK